MTTYEMKRLKDELKNNPNIITNKELWTEKHNAQCCLKKKAEEIKPGITTCGVCYASSWLRLEGDFSGFKEHFFGIIRTPEEIEKFKEDEEKHFYGRL